MMWTATRTPRSGPEAEIGIFQEEGGNAGKREVVVKSYQVGDLICSDANLLVCQWVSFGFVEGGIVFVGRLRGSEQRQMLRG